MNAPSPAMRLAQAKTLQGRIAAVRSTLICAATSAVGKQVEPLAVRDARKLVERHERNVRRLRDAATDKARAEIRKVEDLVLFGHPVAALHAVDALEARAKKAPR